MKYKYEVKMTVRREVCGGRTKPINGVYANLPIHGEKCIGLKSHGKAANERTVLARSGWPIECVTFVWM